MRIALAQPNYHVGNFEYNTSLTLRAIHEAKQQGADLIVFPEMSVCGYPPRDLLFSDVFIDACLGQVKKIAEACKGIAAIVGSPSFNPGPNGKRLRNTAFLLENGGVQGTYHKGLMPTYDVFNEYRYFEPATTFHAIPFKGYRIGLTVCEDSWNLHNQGMYLMNPPDELIRDNPDLLINISASPFAWDHGPNRLRVLSENARLYKLPLFNVNLLGGQTDLIFEGGSAVFNPGGELIDVFPSFEEVLRVYELDEVLNGSGKQIPAVPEKESKYQLIMDALVMGVRDYFRKTGLKQAIVGLSGGIDSAVSLVVAEKALGRENVWAVLLPGPYSSDHSVDDAVSLAKNLGVRHDIISINETVTSLEKSLSPFFKGIEPGVAEENLQARARAVILMGLSNKFGHLLLNTSNKSEAAVGYGTLYGDMCGGLSVLGDVYKTDVYGIAGLINSKQEIIPENTISKPPSAELRPDQKDSDSLPDYEVLDAILFKFIEGGMDAASIVQSGHDCATVRKVLRLVTGSEHKRRQSPPILRVTAKCLGAGREMPLDASYGTIFNC
ncbi:MAG: NAD+ synthase [Bacteroidales bacterium]